MERKAARQRAWAARKADAEKFAEFAARHIATISLAGATAGAGAGAATSAGGLISPVGRGTAVVGGHRMRCDRCGEASVAIDHACTRAAFLSLRLRCSACGFLAVTRRAAVSHECIASPPPSEPPLALAVRAALSDAGTLFAVEWGAAARYFPELFAKRIQAAALGAACADVAAAAEADKSTLGDVRPRKPDGAARPSVTGAGAAAEKCADRLPADAAAARAAARAAFDSWEWFLRAECGMVASADGAYNGKRWSYGGPGFVYVWVDTSTSLVKIGRAVDVESRFKKAQTFNVNVKVDSVFFSLDAVQAEGAAHDIMTEVHGHRSVPLPLSGRPSEWFACALEHARHSARLGCEVASANVVSRRDYWLQVIAPPASPRPGADGEAAAVCGDASAAGEGAPRVDRPVAAASVAALVAATPAGTPWGLDNAKGKERVHAAAMMLGCDAARASERTAQLLRAEWLVDADGGGHSAGSGGGEWDGGCSDEDDA